VTLEDRYVEEVGRLQLQKQQKKVYSYAQAATYNRLGKFLLYPKFVHQLQLVSWNDWFQNVGGKMITCLEASLKGDEEKGAFWMQSVLLPKNMCRRMLTFEDVSRLVLVLLKLLCPSTRIISLWSQFNGTQKRIANRQLIMFAIDTPVVPLAVLEAAASVAHAEAAVDILSEGLEKMKFKK
jgi:hypothetical protein